MLFLLLIALTFIISVGAVIVGLKGEIDHLSNRVNTLEGIVLGGDE